MPNPNAAPTQISAPISIGELIDKITILEIKSERIVDRDKLRNVLAELGILNELKAQAGLDTAVMAPFAQELKMLNGALWEIEDAIRDMERQKDFGDRFVELARSVYRTNDRRAGVKQRINAAFGSQIVEEKSYRDY
jgi:hypothetical protein